MPTATPAIQLPGKGPQPPPFETGVALAGSSGYTKNHLSYQLTHQTLANNAYVLHGGHVVIVEVRAVHMPVGKTKAHLIGVSHLLTKDCYLTLTYPFRTFFKLLIMSLFISAQLTLKVSSMNTFYQHGVSTQKGSHWKSMT